MSEQAVANLLCTCARVLDGGDFEALGQLFAEGAVRFAQTNATYAGASAVRHMYEDIRPGDQAAS